MANHFWSRLGFGRNKAQESLLHEQLETAREEAYFAATEMTRKNAPKGEFTDIPVVDEHAWNVEGIRTAVIAHAGGNFGRAAMLTDAMMADDRVQGATNGRTKGVTKRNVTLEPSDKTKKKALARKVALELESLWAEIFPESTIEDILKWQIFSGFCLTELIWESREDKYVPRLKVWHPVYIYYRLDTRRYVAQTADKGAVEVEPNDPKWALYTPYGSYRGWMRGAVRSCSIPWIVRQYARRDWARYSEVHGLPQKKAKVPAQAPVEDKRRFFAAVKRLGAESAFLLPVPMGGQGAEWDVELLEAKADTWEAFQGLIQECDKSITLTIRGTNLTTEVQTGTGAATDAHRDEDSDYAEADARKLSEFIYKQVLMAYALYNYGDANLAPVPCFELDVEDQESDARVFSTVATAAKTLFEAGWKVDQKAMADRFDIPLLKDEVLAPVEQDQEQELPEE